MLNAGALTLASLLLYPNTLGDGAVFSGTQRDVMKLKFIGWYQLNDLSTRDVVGDVYVLPCHCLFNRNIFCTYFI